MQRPMTVVVVAFSAHRTHAWSLGVDVVASGEMAANLPPHSQWMLPALLAFFVVSGLFEHSPEPIPWVEALAPVIVPAAVAVNVNFWVWAFTIKSTKYCLLCFMLYMAHMYAGTTDFFVEALPSTPAAHVDATKVLVNHIGMFVVRRRPPPPPPAAHAPPATVGCWAAAASPLAGARPRCVHAQGGERQGEDAVKRLCSCQTRCRVLSIRRWFGLRASAAPPPAEG